MGHTGEKGRSHLDPSTERLPTSTTQARLHPKTKWQKTSPQWVLEGDIKGCFDAISHSWLLEHIPMEKAVLKKWLKAGFMQQNVFFPTEAGTPQGGHLFTRISQ